MKVISVLVAIILMLDLSSLVFAQGVDVRGNVNSALSRALKVQSEYNTALASSSPSVARSQASAILSALQPAQS